jgi:hypothetical protein
MEVTKRLITTRAQTIECEYPKNRLTGVLSDQVRMGFVITQRVLLLGVHDEALGTYHVFTYVGDSR